MQNESVISGLNSAFKIFLANLQSIFVDSSLVILSKGLYVDAVPRLVMEFVYIHASASTNSGSSGIPTHPTAEFIVYTVVPLE